MQNVTVRYSIIYVKINRIYTNVFSSGNVPTPAPQNPIFLRSIQLIRIKTLFVCYEN